MGFHRRPHQTGRRTDTERGDHPGWVRLGLRGVLQETGLLRLEADRRESESLRTGTVDGEEPSAAMGMEKDEEGKQGEM